ncbi:hypothetical protein PRIPAC_75167 [Pristionchus pacificus]|uniref:Uncharacterized protein n=1 Tax=Pristionchus pacificus TaxID=54126 RepID=A0A454XKX4_PRIPA|nr:hypothetical protein PRIPAC_75167 [Pristionchus pacificus]|eukprot:PDM73336.1 hypothetical protein PRIPAC_40692 [Pristionchus pacificus]
MSDGIRDVDITYRRLLALKKAHKKDASVAREVFKLLGRSPSKGTLLTSSIDHPLIGRFVRRWKEEVSEDGRVSSVKKRGETPLVSIQFPSGQLTIPVSTLESSLDEGSFDLLDDLL